MLKMDLARHEVTVKSKEVNLTPKEFGLLKFLLTKKGYPLTREELYFDVWKKNPHGKNVRWFIERRVVDQHINRLRRKVGYDLVETVVKYGYKVSVGSIA